MKGIGFSSGAKHPFLKLFVTSNSVISGWIFIVLQGQSERAC